MNEANEVNDNVNDINKKCDITNTNIEDREDTSSLGIKLFLLKKELRKVKRKIAISKIALKYQDDIDTYIDIFENDIPYLKDKRDGLNLAICNIIALPKISDYENKEDHQEDEIDENNEENDENYDEIEEYKNIIEE